MSKLEWRGGALLAPVPPAMISCGTMENANILTIAWTGIVNTIPPKTYISVRPKRFSYPLIRESGEFVINLTTESLIRAADYCGMFTGAKVDKFSACGLHREAVPGFSCPMIAESPMSLACRVTDVIPMGTHDMFLADIVSVHVAEELLDADGKLRLERAQLAAFAHGEYFALGKKLGTFGFSAAKKKKHPQKVQEPQKPGSGRADGALRAAEAGAPGRKDGSSERRGKKGSLPHTSQSYQKKSGSFPKHKTK